MVAKAGAIRKSTFRQRENAKVDQMVERAAQKPQASLRGASSAMALALNWRAPMSSNKYAQEIVKTGFELEFRVSEVFRQLGWTVIANKYYVDDHQGTVREIDLVAYRTTKLQDFRVATIVVVSCKKNDRDAWVLLAKDVDRRDPNMEWQPLHTWSNQRVLKHMLDRSDWRSEYTAFVAQRPCADLHQIPNRHIFAFQEMSKTTGKPDNDRNIFESVTSLMKAQAYELAALPQRNRPPSIYHFNLLSVVETDLVRLDFSADGDIDETSVEEETYVARYIIARQQTFARIHIVQFGALLRVLNRYNALHEANVAFFEVLNRKFYQEAIGFEERGRVHQGINHAGRTPSACRTETRVLHLQVCRHRLAFVGEVLIHREMIVHRARCPPSPIRSPSPTGCSIRRWMYARYLSPVGLPAAGARDGPTRRYGMSSSGTPRPSRSAARASAIRRTNSGSCSSR
jgi:hypothetical protein